MKNYQHSRGFVRFESIFSNLLKNADSYSPSKTTINVKIETLGFDQISIAIENLCLTPLTKEDLAFVFDPLWQKDNARTSTHNFGLGLSIVQTFTNALGGSIGATIDSDVVKFSVILPTH